MKKVTEKDYLLEIERVARLIAYYKHDDKSLEDCRKAITCAIKSLDNMRAKTAKNKSEQEAKRYKALMRI